MSRAGAVADWLGRALLRVPGLLAFVSAVAGAWLLAGLGVALLVAALLLLLIDRRMP